MGCVTKCLGGESKIPKQIVEVINNEISRWKEQDCEGYCVDNREREKVI